jgi:hypothetical protein
MNLAAVRGAGNWLAFSIDPGFRLHGCHPKRAGTHTKVTEWIDTFHALPILSGTGRRTVRDGQIEARLVGFENEGHIPLSYKNG